MTKAIHSFCHSAIPASVEDLGCLGVRVDGDIRWVWGGRDSVFQLSNDKAWLVVHEFLMNLLLTHLWV